jgi:hypothetical protein
MLTLSLLLAAAPARAEDIAVDCPKKVPKVPAIERADVYKDTPFKAGESAMYEVTWAGLKAGYATLEVRSPTKYNGIWHRVFHVEAATGDWFSGVFVAKEAVDAKSRPWDFGIAQFFMDQNEGKLFHSPFVQQKWLDFDHDHCVVHERTKVPDKAEEKADHPLFRGANDSLGVAYNLRARKFKLGQVERAPVYTSEKNWWLEATPLAFEKIQVPAGTFDTVKLKLKTFIGKQMQQQGDVYAWIATSTPEKQLVQIQGEIKLGSVWIKLHSYKAGQG